MPGGLFLNHCVAVRMRVTGSGNLKVRLLSLNGESTSQLPDVAMSPTTQRYVNQLANFITQRYQVEISTEEMDETFNIRQVIIYNKPIASSYPQ